MSRHGDARARGLAKFIAAPVADTTALAAIPAGERSDGMARVNLTDYAVWIFDADSEAAASSTVVEPDAGSGRWLKLAFSAGVAAEDLAATTNGNGASMVGIEDVGLLFDAEDVEAALAEVKDLADMAQRGQATVVKAAADGAAATTTAETALWCPAMACEVTKITFTPSATLTAHDTNYATLTVAKRDGAGGAAADMAAINTKITGGTGNWAAFVAEDFGALTGATLAAGNVLTLEIEKASDGVAVPAGVWTISYILAAPLGA